MDNSSTLFVPHVPLQVIETAGEGGSVSEPKRYVPQFQRRNFKSGVRNEGKKEGLTLWELHYTADFKGGGRCSRHGQHM